MWRKALFTLFLTVIIWQNVFSQRDSTNLKSHNPNLAVALSLVVPGAGQIYNGKFWKVPIIYAGLYTAYYYYSYFNLYYWLYVRDMITVQNGLGAQYTFFGIDNYSVLRTQKEEIRNYRDLVGLGFVLVWAINVLDAYVDAEFYNFDVSEDLSFRFLPIYTDFNQTFALGVTFQMRF